MGSSWSNGYDCPLKARPPVGGKVESWPYAWISFLSIMPLAFTVALTVVMLKVGEQMTTDALIGATVESIGWALAVADPAGKSIPSQIAAGP